LGFNKHRHFSYSTNSTFITLRNLILIDYREKLKNI
jgi:hypothetical protein